MRALAISMALLLGSTAMASSELQLKSSMPVVLVVDGESVGTVQPLEPLLVDIEAGVHNLQLRGMLGKTIYDRDLIFDDDTRTELVWQRKELRLGSVAKLDPNRPKEEVVEEDLGYESAEDVAEAGEIENPPPVDVEHPEEVAAAPPAPSERPPLERPSAPPAAAPPPAAPPPAPVATAPPAPAPVAPPVASPPVKDVFAPRPPKASSGGSVVIEAQPGMDLQITHGSQRLRVTVENGELVVEDANGVEIHFPADGEAF